jgi:hypothetical protein
MMILVVYESSYGNTHLIADAIGEGLGKVAEVEIVPVAKASKELVDRADLVVVGGPTHAHGMSREQTRQAAVDATHKPGSPLQLDPDAEGAGLREWFDTVGSVTASAAAFDTRVDAPALLTGRASKGISHQLRRHGFREIAEPMSFLVTKANKLAVGQLAAAYKWGEQLAATMTAVGAGAGRSDG